MIDLSGTPDPWPAEAMALWAECASLAAGANELWTVPAPSGDHVLREVIANLLGFASDHITIVSSLRAAALTYARRYRRIFLERPSYPGVLPAFSGGAARLRMLPWDDIFGGALPGDPSRTVLWVTSPCRNPDGISLTAANEVALRQRVAAGYRVVVNATYAWFSDRKAPEGVDVTGSLHKLRGVGARIGWVAGPHFFSEAVPELVGTTPSPVWQRAWGLFLRDGGMSVLRESYLARVATAAATFRDHLTATYGLAFPAFDGPSALIPLQDGVSEDAALAELERRGFRLVAGRHFHTTYPALRVTFFGVTPDAAARFADEAATSRLFAIPALTEAVR